MYWKMWKKYGEKPLVVEADNMDEAFKKARELDDGYCSAQPMDEKETRLYEASKPKMPPTHIMSKMCYLYKAGDFDKLEKMYEVAERKGYDMEATDDLLGKLVHAV